MATSLNKTAATFMPKWMKTAEPAAAEAPVTTTTAVAPPQTEEPKPAVPATKLSSTATAFVPKFAVSPATATQPPAQEPAAVAPKPVQNAAPSVAVTAVGPQPTTTTAAGAQPAGIWAKGPPKAPPAVAKAAPSAPVVPSTPPAAPRTPATGPHAPAGGASLYKSPALRPAAQGPAAVPPLPTPAAPTTKLNTAAKEFRPKFLPAAPTRATPPVTPALQPAAPAPGTDAASDALPTSSPAAATEALRLSGMPLDSLWSLFYVDRAPQGTAGFAPTLVYDMRSVEDFWRTFNNLPTLTRSDGGATYYMFRDRIAPKWEDPANKLGGAWTVRVFPSMEMDPDTIDVIWERLLARTVGGDWWERHRNTVTGLVAKIRDRGFVLQFWVTERMDDFPNDVASCISNLYPAFKMDYLSHQAASEAATVRDKEKQETAKNNKKKRNY